MKILFFLLVAMLAVSCSDDPKDNYKVEWRDYLPDSNRVKVYECMRNTVAAASNQMTGGDYEDPEDVVVQAQKTCESIFSIKAKCLVLYKQGWASQVLFPEQMNAEQKKLFDSLKDQLR